MELNHLLLFAATASAALLLAQSVRHGGAAWRWQAAAAVLGGSLLAWLWWPRLAGFAAAALWLALLFIPALTQRWRRSPPDLRSFRPRITPIVAVLLLVNVAVFAVEIAFGGSTNPAVLHKLGELDSAAVLRGDYWRIAAALFLHYGAVHLLLNMLGLYLLGVPLETEIGPMRFLLCYAFSGLASSLTVVAFTVAALLPPLQLVGASGAVMGVLGGWTGFLLRHRADSVALQQLRNVAVLVALQVLFDLLTPRVSLSAHMAGFIAGLLVGVCFGSARREKTCRRGSG